MARELNLIALDEFENVSGGQAIEWAAKRVKDKNNFPFPDILTKYRNCNFSMGGLKNVAYRLIDHHKKLFGKFEKKTTPKIHFLNLLDVDEHEVVPEYEDISYGVLFGVTRQLCKRTQRAMAYIAKKHLFSQSVNTLVRTLYYFKILVSLLTNSR